ncbi:MAG: tRNA lysidine(34) synthetase TilS [Hyphomicrobiaceae bacterium]
MNTTGGSGEAQAIEPAMLSDLFSPLKAFDGLVIAVSGGADSMALLHLLAQWRAQLFTQERAPAPVFVVATVDHGMRPEAKDEALFVAQCAMALGLDHETVEWSEEKPTSGLQDGARVARYRLLEEVGVKHWPTGQVGVVTAHTRDDQVETFMMRLARGSGLEGLAGMEGLRQLSPLTHVKLLRPFLTLSKAQLVATLKAKEHKWIEDPSNQDQRFERVRWRRHRKVFDELGLTDEALAKSITRLRRADAAIEAGVTEMARAVDLNLHHGLFASFGAPVFANQSSELRVRFLSRLLRAYGGQLLPPRLMKVEALVHRLATHIDPDQEVRETLGGCIIQKRGREISVMREPSRRPLPSIELPCGATKIWDHRFRVSCARQETGAIVVQALGREGKDQLVTASGEVKDSLAVAPTTDVAATLPGFWRDGQLVSVPIFNDLRGLDDDRHEASYRAEFIFSDLFAQHTDPFLQGLGR